MKNYFMGIDVGSTTIKIYITDQDDNCIYSKYERHYSDIQATIKTLFNDVKEKFKGVNRHEGVEVNTKMPEELRRVPFQNIIYVADGPSDIPAFSLVNKNHGATFAIYPHGDMEAMRQVEQMRVDGRINMYAEADYQEGKTAYMWFCPKIKECAERIRKREREKISVYAQTGTTKHLTY